MVAGLTVGVGGEVAGPDNTDTAILDLLLPSLLRLQIEHCMGLGQEEEELQGSSKVLAILIHCMGRGGAGQQGSSRTLSAAELEAQGMQLLVAADAAGELQVCVCLYACVYAVTFVLCSHKFLHYINTSLCSPVRF